jgi:hypothetical protein
MRTLNKKDVNFYELQYCLNQLKIEIRQQEEWCDRAKETAHQLQEIIFDIQEDK